MTRRSLLSDCGEATGRRGSTTSFDSKRSQTAATVSTAPTSREWCLMSNANDRERVAEPLRRRHGPATSFNLVRRRSTWLALAVAGLACLAYVAQALVWPDDRLTKPSGGAAILSGKVGGAHLASDEFPPLPPLADRTRLWPPEVGKLTH